MKVIFISGLSGAGKSTALNALEDIGFYCSDNMPLPLIPDFLKILQDLKNIRKVAVVIDIREGEFLDYFESIFKKIKKMVDDYEFLFLEASEEIIIRRYSETRRKHPLGSLQVGIKEEKERLKLIREKATRIIDTSFLNVHQLKKIITRIFVSRKNLFINIVSFGYKYGLPEDADLLFDVRFLPNPYFIEELKPLTGRDLKVKNYVLSNPSSRKFLSSLNKFFNFLLPEYMKEGKIYLTIGFGCTGGKHRSVVIADSIYEFLSRKYSDVRIIYRDLGKE